MSSSEKPQNQSIYIGHGAPLNILWDTPYKRNLQKFAKNASLPGTIVVVSAHWEQNIPLQITSADYPGIIYDYYGFPQEMYELEYNVPGNPKLAQKIANELGDHGWNTLLNPDQGLDHGAWIPLKIMYPDANIPVLQLSIPIPRHPDQVYKIGQILSKFRHENIMFMGSGNLIHNLRHAFMQLQASGKTMDDWTELPVESWAKETDATVKEYLDNSDTDSLLNSPSKIPRFRQAAPTTEHYDPLYFVLGTMEEGEAVNYIHEGFEAGSISMRSFASES